jgi:MFS family permease
MKRTFAALQSRNYRLFYLGQVVSLCGTWMQSVAQPWLVYQLTDSALWLGLVSGTASLFMSLSSLWGGVVADRVRKRKLLLLTQAASMTLALILAALTYSQRVQVWHIAILAASLGVVNGFDLPTRQAFVLEIVPREDLVNAIALNSTMFNIARMAGPALAGVLVVRVGLAGIFLLNGVSYLAVMASLLAIREAPLQQAESQVPVWRHLSEGWQYVSRTPQVRGLLILLAIISLFGWSYAVLMPVFAHEVLHVGARGLGFLMSAIGVGALGGALLLASLGHGRLRARYLYGGLGLFLASLWLFAISQHFLLSLLALTLAGGAMITYMNTSNALLQLTVPEEMQGRVMGFRTLVFAGLTPLGSAVLGGLAEVLGAPQAVRSVALLCGLAAGIAYAFFPAMRRLAQVPASGSPPPDPSGAGPPLGS